jgi:hypothetical protein
MKLTFSEQLKNLDSRRMRAMKCPTTETACNILNKEAQQISCQLFVKIYRADY